MKDNPVVRNMLTQPWLRLFGILGAIFACLSIHCAVLHAQQDTSSTGEERYASRGRTGIGVRGGVVHFSGDVKNELDFSGTRTPFHAGGDLLFHARLWQAVQGDNAMRFGLEASAGYRVLKASHPSYEFRTRAFPVSVSLTIEFYSASSIRPFVSGGMGALPYESNILRSRLVGTRVDQAVPAERNAAFWLPLRIGLRFASSPSVDFHISLERSITLSDRIDGIVTKDLDWMNDNFETLMIGLTVYFLGKKAKDPYGDVIATPLEMLDEKNRTEDTDRDGISDDEEIALYHTDPSRRDTDGDGLEDGEEVFRQRTNPLLADTDGDGLTDGREIAIGTNPVDRDTDKDGISDGMDDCPKEAETFNNFKDEDGCPDETERGELIFHRLGEILVIENIEFEMGKAVLLPKSYPILDKVSQSLRSNPKVHIEIRGHTDSTGSYERNIQLSLERAEAVKSHLVSKGIEPARISTKGFGPTQPIAPNGTPEGRQRNRRIEIRITEIGE
ncbi:MAG: OmpA family protein [Bacteroidota bacterium]|nr:OmpA family protein [Bacteroidota bacterium]